MAIRDENILKFAALKNKQESYLVDSSCLNCGQGFSTTIPKGTTVRAHNPTCPNCGCRMRDVQREFNEDKV